MPPAPDFQLHRRPQGVSVRRFVAIMVATASLLGCSRESEPQISKPVEPTTTIVLYRSDPTASPPRPGDPVISERINAGVYSLRALSDDIDGPTLLVLARLGNRAGNEELTAFSETGIHRLRKETRGTRSDDLRRSQLRMVGDDDSVDPEALAFVPINDIDAIVWTLNSALYCDTDKFPANWSDSARTAMENEVTGYVTTHVALSYVIFDERGCENPDPQLRQDVIDRTTTAVASSETADDLTIENLVLLQELHVAADIPDGWVSRVLEAQLAGGGWAREPQPHSKTDIEVPIADWHTTSLAVWFLLNYQNPTLEGNLFTP